MPTQVFCGQLSGWTMIIRLKLELVLQNANRIVREENQALSVHAHTFLRKINTISDKLDKKII